MTINLLEVKSILESYLGTPIPHKKNGEYSFHCPNCNHHKKKLQVNISTQAWKCWICDTEFKGRSIANLLKRIDGSPQDIKKVKAIYQETGFNYDSRERVSHLRLPQEFKPLHIKQNTPDYKNALHYILNVRKLTPYDVLRYNVGYCEEGPYSGMIIIPSYDEDNNLNYFVARSYYMNSTFKHKNPDTSRDIVGFESLINWKMPLVIAEGSFDAISIKINCTPLFGKVIQNNLRKKIIQEGVKCVYLALDPDAFKNAVKEIEYFLNEGIEVYHVRLPQGEDPNSLGYEKMQDLINNAKKIDFFDLITYKMAL